MLVYHLIMRKSIYTEELLRVLHKGGIALIPTDTIYGIVASVKNDKAMSKVFKVKRRGLKKKLIVLISDPTDMLEFGVDGIDIQKCIDIWKENDRPTSIAVTAE